MKFNFLLLDADYIVENNRGLTRLFCKDKFGKTMLVLDSNFEPYFYVKPKEGKLNDLSKKIKDFDFKDKGKVMKIETVEKEFFGQKIKLLKLIVDNPRNVPDIRDVVKEWKEVEEEYEYTEPFAHRYVIDKNIEPMGWVSVDGETVKTEKYQVDQAIKAKSVKPIDYISDIDFKILSFDLELVEERGEEKIIMISLFDKKGMKKVLTAYKWSKAPNYVEVFNDEKSMIERFIKIVTERDPDFIVGYNSDAFDFIKLRERCEKLKVALKLGRDNSTVKLERRGRISAASITGRVHIDLFNFVDHILSPTLKTEVLTLDAVAQELLGLGKKDVKWKEIRESWKEKKNLERIADYALRDAELTLMLANHLLPQIFSIARLTRTFAFDASRYYYSQLVENFFVRKAVTHNVLLPNRPKYEEIQARSGLPAYTGAIVIEPKKGIHSNILVFDFRSLYPTIIVTHNISPETFNCKHDICEKSNKIPGTKYHFCTKQRGFIPTYLEFIIKKRQEVKAKMKQLKKDTEEWRKLDHFQYALKIIANATYGYLGYSGARWYCRECAESSAAFGRFYITKVIEDAKKTGFDVIYADTDSNFVVIPGLSKNEVINKSQKWLEKINKELPGIIELEFRDIYAGGIFVARRGEEKGAKKRYALIDYEGNLEIRGFEAIRADWCQLAKNIQHEVLRIILQEKDSDKAIKLARDTVKKLQEGKAKLDELTIYTQLTMPISEYKQIGPHVKVAMKMRDRGRPVGAGMVIEYIITKGKGSISDRAEPVEDVKEGQYDPEYYVNNQVLPAAMRVLQALELTEEQVLSGKAQAKLGEWFRK